MTNMPGKNGTKKQNCSRSKASPTEEILLKKYFSAFECRSTKQEKGTSIFDQSVFQITKLTISY